ncbi:MAG: element excision factor XisI family protein [Oscillochloridaceae bacterium umkhey_bin13]
MGATLTAYRAIVWRVLEGHAAIPLGAGTATSFVVFDPHLDRFLLVTVGWQGGRRIHSTAAHIALADDKVWIEHDGLPPPGLATELIEAGIPKTAVVLAFQTPYAHSSQDVALS